MKKNYLMYFAKLILLVYGQTSLMFVDKHI